MNVNIATAEAYAEHQGTGRWRISVVGNGKVLMAEIQAES
jgi:hypothetical protein